jgi:hypothetical protein
MSRHGQQQRLIHQLVGSVEGGCHIVAVKDHCVRNLGIGGRIILKGILNCGRVWAGFKIGFSGRLLVNTVVNL